MRKGLRFLNNLIYLLVLFLFVFIPLYPKFPLLNVNGTFVAIRIEDLIIALTIGLWGLSVIFSGQIRNFLKNRLNQSLLLFFFIGLVSTFSAIFLTHTVTYGLGLLNFLRRVEFMMLLPVIIYAVNSKKRLFLILFALLFTVVTVDMYALGQKYLDWPVISTTNSEFAKGLILRLTPDARVNSTFAGHYDLAVFLAGVLVIFTPMFFAVRKRLKPIILVIGALSLLVLIMTAARLSFVAAFVGIISALIFSKKKKYILLLFISVFLILIYPSQLRDRFVSTITINIFHMGERYTGKTADQQARSKLNIPTLAIQTSSVSASTSTFASPSGGVATDITPGEPIDSTELGVFRSFEIRLNIEWPRAIRAFIKNPFLGTGYSSLGIATDNDFLRSLGEVGLLGSLALFLVIVEIGKKIVSYFNNENRFLRYFSVGVFSMLITFLINGLFIDVFEASKVASLFWMILGLNLSVINFNENIKRI